MRKDLRRIRSNSVWWLNHQWNTYFHGLNAANPAAFLKRVTETLESLHREGKISFPFNPQVHSLIDFGDMALGKPRAGSVGLVIKNDVGLSLIHISEPTRPY